MSHSEIELRYATEEDIPGILDMIRELAAFERAPDEVTVTTDDLRKDGFGEHPLFRVILAEYNKNVAGMAFYFISYSTWKGKCVYLEDIIVKENYRGKGIGKALFGEMIRVSHVLGAKRLHWQVLDWNEPAINFYRRYGSAFDNTWVNGKLTDVQIKRILHHEKG